MLITVGGHSRNVGKTSVVCGIISAVPEARWQAIKITQHGHNLCSVDGHGCSCAPGDASHPYALDEQTEHDSTDSGRYLAAGAARSWWLRTAQGELGYAMPSFRSLLPEAENTIVESNSLLRFYTPDLYVVVLDFFVEDLKDSSRQNMDRADVFIVNRQGRSTVPWAGVPARWFESKAVFEANPPEYVSADAAAFFRHKLLRSAPPLRTLE